MIYLDNAATTFPKPEEVYNAMDKINRECAVNAGRGSYRLARQASKIISDTKQALRELVHLTFPAEVVFSPSITIALNQIIYGLDIKDDMTIYVSPFEHNAVARSIQGLSKEKKIRIKELPLDEGNFSIDLDKLKYEFVKDKPAAVFCTHVSNVTGYVLPVELIFKETKKYNGITILDSAQSLGLIEVNANSIGADIIAFAGHKTLYGPFGIGGFINVSNISLKPRFTGGTGSDSLNLEMPIEKETRYEPASSNIVAIAGLKAAIEILSIDENRKKEIILTQYLQGKLKEIKEVLLYSDKNESEQTGIVSFVVNGYKSDEIGQILDEDFDIAVRTGYHCAPYIHKYLKDENTLGTIRVGIGRFTTKNDIDKLVDAIKEIVNE